MLRFFKPLQSPSEVEEATLRGFHQSAAAAASSAPTTPHRGPGRPRKVAPAAPLLSPARDDSPPAKRVHRNWLLSPFIYDILAAYERCGRSARKTVEFLQRSHPRQPTEVEARYERLSESTVRSWHESGTAAKKLLPHVQALIEKPEELLRGHGRPRALDDPAITEEIRTILTTMRERGSMCMMLQSVSSWWKKLLAGSSK
jgi:hypothetical protein